MGTLDAIRDGYGEEFDQGGRASVDRHTWEVLCVCGHLGKYHSQSTGGSYRTLDGEGRIRGEPVRVVTEFGGCLGAMPTKGVPTETQRADHDRGVLTITLHPTCPCTEFRPIADVDRPNRFFNQRVFDRHPFMVGVGALAKHLAKRKAAQTDPDWAKAEFDRRFRWIEASQRCSISGCKATGKDVLPAYVDRERLSEMRCAAHR